MEFNINEWLNIFVRWFHLIFGIMWIGNSFYFNWLDNSMREPEEEREDVKGEVWMFHGGGFYLVEKRQMQPDKLPKPLHWFKYESYFTWISGFCLITVVYYMNAKVMMLNPSNAILGSVSAPLLGMFVLFGGWLFYDWLWRNSQGENKLDFIGITAVFIVLVAFGLSQVFTGRAAYIHVGALMATMMTFNVFFHIIPLQKKSFQAAMNGEVPDPNWARTAKQRSRHNNYFTFPVLFIMISNHFPSTYGHSLNWVVLVVFMGASATIKHFMNVHEAKGGLQTLVQSVVVTVCLAAVAFASLYKLPTSKEAVKTLKNSSVSFAQVRAVINQRCVPCHSKYPTDNKIPVPKTSVMDTPKQIQQLAGQIKTRAVLSKSMPLGNKTKMTELERRLLGKWISQGAQLK